LHCWHGRAPTDERYRCQSPHISRLAASGEDLQHEQGSGLRLNRPPGGADANEPWTVSRTNTYRGAVLPKGANTGGGALEGCSHGSTGTGHNQRANSFGPNELPAIATSGDTMLAFWMGLPAAIVFRPPWRSADFLEGPGAAAQMNVPPASQSCLEL